MLVFIDCISFVMYLYKVINRNTWTTCQICSKVKTKMVFLLLILNIWVIMSSTVIIAEFEQINATWAWETIDADNKFAFSNWEIYYLVGWNNLLGYKFSSLLMQNRVIKRIIPWQTFPWQNFEKISWPCFEYRNIHFNHLYFRNDIIKLPDKIRMENNLFISKSFNFLILIFHQFSVIGLLFPLTHITMKTLALQKVC